MPIQCQQVPRSAATHGGNRHNAPPLRPAAHVITKPFNLTEHPADFAAVSFYKMTGYPTGGRRLAADTMPPPLRAGARQAALQASHPPLQVLAP